MMARRFCLAVAAAAAIITATLISSALPAPDLLLHDQFDNEVKLSEFNGKLRLIVYWDRISERDVSGWVMPVRKEFGTGANKSLTLVHATNLKDAPAFLHPGIKSKFQKRTDGGRNGPILLDWKGEVARAFGYRSGLVNLYLIDTHDTVVFTTSGRGTPEEVSGLLQQIRRQIAAGSS